MILVDNSEWSMNNSFNVKNKILIFQKTLLKYTLLCLYELNSLAFLSCVIPNTNSMRKSNL